MPTYHAMSLLFHMTVPGWQSSASSRGTRATGGVPTYEIEGHASNDTAGEGARGVRRAERRADDHRSRHARPEPERVVHDPPSAYSIGGLPPNTEFNLALWNATARQNSIAGTVTTDAAGVARFEVPLQAAFALTTVPVS